jgi:hypothetical protein
MSKRLARRFVTSVLNSTIPKQELATRAGFEHPYLFSSLLDAKTVELLPKTVERLVAVASIIGFQGDILEDVIPPDDFDSDHLPKAG